MTEQATVTNLGSNDDVRTFQMCIDVPEPQVDQTITFCIKSAFPFEIIEVIHHVEVGEVAVQVLNGGVAVELSDETDGNIVADQTPSVHEPVSTNFDNFTVAGDASLVVVLQDVQSGSLEYTLQITARRTQTNA